MRERNLEQSFPFSYLNRIREIGNELSTNEEATFAAHGLDILSISRGWSSAAIFGIVCPDLTPVLSCARSALDGIELEKAQYSEC